VYKIAQHLGTTPVTLVPFTGQADATWETARAQKYLGTTWKPSKCMQQAILSSKFPPLLTMHQSSQKCQKFNLELLKYTKFNIGCYTCPNEKVRYSIASY
jgi:hypothetical protein